MDDAADKDEIVKLFIHRYQHPHFQKARYVFFVKDAAGRQALSTFRELMAQVVKKHPEAAHRIEVRTADREACSAAEMYFGHRDGRDVCVIELKEPTAEPRHALPRYYLVSHDEGLITDFLQNYFEPAWEAATPVSLAG